MYYRSMARFECGFKGMPLGVRRKLGWFAVSEYLTIHVARERARERARAQAKAKLFAKVRARQNTDLI